MRLMLILFFAGMSMRLAAQQGSGPQLIRTIPGEFTSFAADVLGNLYTIGKDNQLKKSGPSGDSVGVYNDVRRFGKLSYIDASNPLKTLLFYRDFRTIVVLDRFLNVVNTIDLRKQNIFQAKAICTSYDNNIWVWDEQESKLRKIGEDGRILSETADLRMVFDEVPVPATLFDQDGFVYCYDPARGMYVFDYYGAFKNRLPLLQWKDLQVIGKTILGRLDGKLMTYTVGTLQLNEKPLPAALRDSERIRLMRQGIFVLDADAIRLFTLQ